jgi:hypothetical protein
MNMAKKIAAGVDRPECRREGSFADGGKRRMGQPRVIPVGPIPRKCSGSLFATSGSLWLPSGDSHAGSAWTCIGFVEYLALRCPRRAVPCRSAIITCPLATGECEAAVPTSLARGHLLPLASWPAAIGSSVDHDLTFLIGPCQDQFCGVHQQSGRLGGPYR